MSEIWFMVRYTFVSKSLHCIPDAVFPKNLTFFPRRYSGFSCTSTQPMTLPVLQKIFAMHSSLSHPFKA